MRLFVTDLDGTLLRSDRTLSPFAVNALTRLIVDGVAITYSTARTADKAAELLTSVPFRLPAIVFNGAMAVRADTGEVLKSNLISIDIVTEIIGIATKHGVPPFVLGREGARDVLLHSDPTNPGQQLFLEHRAGDPRLRYSATVEPLEHTLAINIEAELSAVERVRLELERMFSGKLEFKQSEDIYAAGHYVLEIFSVGVDKARMLEFVAELLGVALADVTVFGDHLSDLGMLRVAGTAVAVRNAHPEALQAAQVVVPSNDEDGVVHYLLEHHAVER